LIRGNGGTKRWVGERNRGANRIHAISAEVVREEGPRKEKQVDLEEEAMKLISQAYVEAKRSYDRTFEATETQRPRKRRVHFAELPEATPLVQAIDQLQGAQKNTS
jgi:hypothetical protein